MAYPCGRGYFAGSGCQSHSPFYVSPNNPSGVTDSIAPGECRSSRSDASHGTRGTSTPTIPPPSDELVEDQYKAEGVIP